MPSAFEFCGSMLCGLAKTMDRKQGTSPGSTGGTGQVHTTDIAPGAGDVRLDEDGHFYEAEASGGGVLTTQSADPTEVPFLAMCA